MVCQKPTAVKAEDSQRGLSELPHQRLEEIGRHEEGAQREVPAPPEILDRGREEGRVEVLGQAQAEQ